TTTRRFELLDVPSVSRLCSTAWRVLTRKIQTVMLRMVSAVRRGFRTVFFKMSRIILIGVLLLDESRPKPSQRAGNPQRCFGSMRKKVEANPPCKSAQDFPETWAEKYASSPEATSVTPRMRL